MNKNLSITTFLGIIAIVLGAFASHSLKEKLSPEAMNSLETAIRYQMYHVIVLLFVNVYHDFSNQLKNQVSIFFFLGIVFFSGSIYAIYLIDVSPKSIWFVTPIGGLFFIVGWARMFLFFVQRVINNK